MDLKSLIIYLLFINLFSVLICTFDKSQARANKYRISEKALFLISVIGGSVAMYITMRVIRHKTRKKKFMIGIPLIIVFQISLMALYIFKF